MCRIALIICFHLQISSHPFSKCTVIVGILPHFYCILVRFPTVRTLEAMVRRVGTTVTQNQRLEKLNTSPRSSDLMLMHLHPHPLRLVNPALLRPLALRDSGRSLEGRDHRPRQREVLAVVDDDRTS